MNEEKEKQLVKAYPNLYRHYKDDPAKYSIGWGIETEDGWYDLIDALSAKLEAIIVSLPSDTRESVYAAQVKQKFGTLRFYIDGISPEMAQFVSDAEKASETICEMCGEKGRRATRQGWIRTLCNRHIVTQPDSISGGDPNCGHTYQLSAGHGTVTFFSRCIRCDALLSFYTGDDPYLSANEV